MKKAIAVLAVLSLAAFAGQIAVSLSERPELDADWLTYDDGTPKWVWWGGTYRGTWFNTADFTPVESYAGVQESEIWFYHHENGPWDTSDVYIELWNGDFNGPIPGAQLDQTMATASHYAPINTVYSPEIVTEENFWCFINTEMSAGGWPSIITDGTNPIPGSVFHTFASDDFIVWEPYGDETGARNAWIFVLAELYPLESFDNTTWGSLKTVF